MGPPPHLLVPDSSVKALIGQQRSSSSPTSSIDSPTQPSVSTASPSQHSSHIYNPASDLSLPSSSSSSLSSVVPEITPVHENEGLRHRRRTKPQPVHKEDKQDAKSGYPSQERSKHGMSTRSSGDFHKKKKGCHDNMCCKCAAGFTADCAAVCCCPLALLHLTALAFIRLPTAVAWKMLVSLKNKICTKQWSAKKESEEDSPRPNFASPWSHGSSPEGRVDPKAHSENLWRHFEEGSLDFGSLSLRREPP